MGLDLNFSTYSLAKPLSQFLNEVSKIKDNHSKLSEIDGYVRKLEEERKKIEVFKRELPLCMLLLTEAIETLKEEASSVMASNGKFDVGEGEKLETDNNKKNWMSSAQLWISNSKTQLQSKNEEGDRSVTQTCNYSNQGGALPSFNLPLPPLPAPLSLMTPKSEILTGYSRIEESHHIQKKEQRRRWSEDLHRRFVDALRRIGGSQVATPKQIRDMMKVDGLTNDEVKSHLQKYRMHIRKHLLSSPSDQPGLLRREETQSLISVSRSDSPQGPLVVDRGLFSNNGGHSSEDEQEKSDGRSWKKESRMKKRQGLDLEL